jgi:hypothetical protein
MNLVKRNMDTNNVLVINYELIGKYKTTEFQFMKPKCVITLKMFVTSYNLEQQYETIWWFMKKLKQCKKCFVLIGSKALIIPTTFQNRDIYITIICLK